MLDFLLTYALEVTCQFSPIPAPFPARRLRRSPPRLPQPAQYGRPPQYPPTAYYAPPPRARAPAGRRAGLVHCRARAHRRECVPLHAADRREGRPGEGQRCRPGQAGQARRSHLSDHAQQSQDRGRTPRPIGTCAASSEPCGGRGQGRGAQKGRRNAGSARGGAAAAGAAVEVRYLPGEGRRRHG